MLHLVGQNFAYVGLGLFHSMGIPARYVSSHPH